MVDCDAVSMISAEAKNKYRGERRNSGLIRKASGCGEFARTVGIIQRAGARAKNSRKALAYGCGSTESNPVMPEELSSVRAEYPEKK